MKKIKLLLDLSVLLSFLFIMGCSEEDNTPPSITAFATELGQPAAGEQVLLTVGSDAEFGFNVQSEAEIKMIEIWKFEGMGITESEPIKELSLEYPSVIIGNSYSFTDTIEDLETDVRYSIYVQDMNDSYSSAYVNLFLDVTRYSGSLTDGSVDGTTPTFYNIESGRSLYVANTIGDPKGIDFGFSYLESDTTMEACLVSFNEYYKVGNYAMVVNDNNNSTIFKDASAISASFVSIYDAVENASQLKTYFDDAVELEAVYDVASGNIAADLELDDIIAFQAEDGRYGLIQVTDVDRKSGSLRNDQTISFDIIVEKENSSL